MRAVHELLEQLRSFDITPLVYAIVLGGLIGLEREIHGRPAGLRTHILVCLCSTILMVASRSVPPITAGAPENAPNIVFDPQRLAAGIVTGIGFLGAAAVVRSGDMVRGLTTGACIWSVAALGVVIGHQEYALATMATMVFLLVLICFNWFTGGLPPIVYRHLILHGDSADAPEVVAAMRGMLQRHKIRLQDVTGTYGSPIHHYELDFHVRCRNRIQAANILEEVTAWRGVQRAEWRLPQMS
jgi:putative Mg2+ transporter-C (MgtC) family protein